MAESLFLREIVETVLVGEVGESCCSPTRSLLPSNLNVYNINLDNLSNKDEGKPYYVYDAKRKFKKEKNLEVLRRIGTVHKRWLN
jgi:hypothetical protein